TSPATRPTRQCVLGPVAAGLGTAGRRNGRARPCSGDAGGLARAVGCRTDRPGGRGRGAPRGGRVNPPERVLIVLLGAIGDVVCGLPLAQRLRAGWPRTRI